MDFKHCPVFAQHLKECTANKILKYFKDIKADFITVSALYDLLNEKYGFTSHEIFDQTLQILVNQGHLFIAHLQSKETSLCKSVDVVFIDPKLESSIYQKISK